MAKAKVKSKKKTIVKAKVKKPLAKAAKKAPVKAKTKLKTKPVAKAKVKPVVKSQVKIQKPNKPSTKPALKPSGKTKLVDVSDFVTPLDDRMIIQPSEEEKVTAGGLIIPDTVSTVSGNRKGVVLSVGRGHRDPKGRVRPMDVKKGDKIVFPEYAGSKLIYEGHDLIILRETDVMGVLD